MFGYCGVCHGVFLRDYAEKSKRTHFCQVCQKEQPFKVISVEGDGWLEVEK
jgi:hypothetical protein